MKGKPSNLVGLFRGVLFWNFCVNLHKVESFVFLHCLSCLI